MRAWGWVSRRLSDLKWLRCDSLVGARFSICLVLVLFWVACTVVFCAKKAKVLDGVLVSQGNGSNFRRGCQGWTGGVGGPMRIKTMVITVGCMALLDVLNEMS